MLGRRRGGRFSTEARVWGDDTGGFRGEMISDNDDDDDDDDARRRWKLASL